MYLGSWGCRWLPIARDGAFYPRETTPHPRPQRLLEDKKQCIKVQGTSPGLIPTLHNKSSTVVNYPDSIRLLLTLLEE
jgi:hypothetical protein